MLLGNSPSREWSRDPLRFEFDRFPPTGPSPLNLRRTFRSPPGDPDGGGATEKDANLDLVVGPVVSTASIVARLVRGGATVSVAGSGSSSVILLTVEPSPEVFVCDRLREVLARNRWSKEPRALADLALGERRAALSNPSTSQGLVG